MDYELRNIKDFLQMYNKITDMCFNSCVENLFSRDLSRDETLCADNCVSKFANVNQRLLHVYMGVQTDINQRRMSEMEVQQTKMVAETQQRAAEPKIQEVVSGSNATDSAAA